MSDIPRRVRDLFDRIAPPIDVENLDGARLPMPSRRSGWERGLVAGLAAVLLVGSGLVWLSGGASNSGRGLAAIPEALDPATGQVWLRTTPFQREIIGDGETTFLELQASMAAVVSCIRESGDWFVGGEVLETGEHSITVADATGVGDPPTGPTSNAALDEAQTRCMREYFDDVLLVYLNGDRGEPHIRVTLSDDTTDDELARAVAEVFALDGVTFAKGLNREAAFAEFSELFAGCQGIVEAMGRDLSALPITIKVWVDLDTNVEDDTEIVDVANRVLTAMTIGGYGLLDIELTRDTPPSEVDCLIPTETPTTTMPVPAQLEQAGLDLVDEITADGLVSRDEFTLAVEGMASCMTDHGLAGVTWSVDQVGNGWSIDYESPSDDSEAIYSLCYYSYIPDEGLRSQPVPYLGLDLPGWEFWRASESEMYCSDEPVPMPGSSRGITYTLGVVAPEDDPLFVGVSSVGIHVRPASARCSFQEVPTSASDLGPPADPPFVIDHGMTTVLGRQARIVEEQGTFSVLWLVDDHGSTATMHVFPMDTEFTLDQIIAIAAGIVELTPSDWETLLAATPETPPVTVP